MCTQKNAQTKSTKDQTRKKNLMYLRMGGKRISCTCYS